jgi:3',5'-cyclic-AMP phosphodiesterase
MFPYKVTAFILTAGILLLLAAPPQPDSFRFVILGDRTGEAQPGVYEHLWKTLASQTPAFVVSVGDTIQGTNDNTAESQWLEAEQMLAAWKRFPLYLAAGNHDIWSVRSEDLFRKYSGHAPHYSFDYLNAHFTVLDNSRSDQLSAGELAFLDADLAQHNAQPLKFIVSHRPSWVLNAMLGDPAFELQRIAKKYGARYVLAGHIHELLHAELEGIHYISMPSAGGHLRASGKYADGWFFGYTVVDIKGRDADFSIRESDAPFGQSRSTVLGDWGKAGLLQPAP